MNSVTSINKLDLSHNPPTKGGKSAPYDQSSDESDQEEDFKPVSDNDENKPLTGQESTPTINQSGFSELTSADFDLGGAVGGMDSDRAKQGTSTDESKV